MVNGCMRIKEAMECLAPWNPKRQPTINSYCMQDMIPAIREGDLWFIEKDYIEKAIQWRKGAVATEEILDGTEGFSDLGEEEKKWCTRKVNKMTVEYLTDEARYSILFAGRLVMQEDVPAVMETITEIVRQYVDRAAMIPVSEAAEKAGMSVYQLTSFIKSGRIKAQKIENNWYITKDELEKFIGEKALYIGLMDIVAEILPHVNTMFDMENQSNRSMLNARVRNSELSPLLVSWKDAAIKGDRRNAYFVPADSKEEFKKLLVPYLRQYGIAEKRVRMLEEDAYWQSHPKTRDAVQGFSEGKVSHGMAALMETLVENLECEIMDADDNQISSMVDYTQKALTDIYQMYIAKFLRYVKEHYDCRFTMLVDYRTGKAHKKSINYSPYSEDEYFLFSYMNFNDDFIKEKGMVKKAAEDPKCAFLWLRNCWHYTGMWREIDIQTQIPAVSLKCTRKELKERILSGEFSEQDADNLSIMLEALIAEKQMEPHKTRKERLRVHFSESIRPVIGLAYACCLVHAQGEYIEGIKATAALHRWFYGSEYEKIFGNKPFMNRRANKSYADSLMTLTERTSGREHKVLGYVLVTYARGHAHRNGELSGMTHRYLSYKLDGLSDNEILMLLMEMGPCSFTVNMLLEAVYGDKYQMLPIQQQAEIVKETGLTAYTAEIASSAVLKAVRRSKKLATELLESYPTPEGQKKACQNAMVNLIEGRAASKNDGISCLNMAFLRPCSEPRCEECLGCENAILHKGAFLIVFKTLEEAYKKMHSAKTEATRDMYRALIDQKYLPAAFELLAVCKNNYNMEISQYSKQIRNLIINEEVGSC